MALTISETVYLGKAVPDSGGSTPVIDTLNVTPTTSAQQITAPSGTDGYSPVNVSAVTSSIDANIVAGNIKKDVQILGVTGSYEGTTPTGTKSITANGVYDVTDFASADIQVPTTAPAYYIEKVKDANDKLNNGSTVIDLSGVKDLGDNVLNSVYRSNSSISSVNFSSLTSISGQYALQNAFMGSSVTSVDLSGVTTINGYYTCQQAFYNCSGITSANLGNLTSVTNQYACHSMFRDDTNLTTVNVSSLTKISATEACEYMFSNTGITSIDLSNLTVVSGSSACQYMFASSGLTSIEFQSLVSIVGQITCQWMFSRCSSLTVAKFYSLKSAMNSRCLKNCFDYCTSLANVYFYALNPSSFNSTDIFGKMLLGVTGCTVHFPSNIQSVIGSWSSVTDGFAGTNTTVLFDLPATVTLTGDNTVNYERNPRYDTQTALAWRVKDSGTTTDPIIDWTPYYTSGLTDPTVGTTIYSDSACTIAETTVDSIA